MSKSRSDIFEELFAALQDYERLFQFRDPNNACLFDLRVNECYALEIIAKGGPISVNSLAESLGVHKSNASRIARSLQAGKFVEEIPDNADKRSVLWRATARGRAKYESVRDYLAERFSKILTDYKRPDLVNAINLLVLLTKDAKDRLAEQCQTETDFQNNN